MSGRMNSDGEKSSKSRIWGSDIIADALREQDIPYVCLVPGASFRGLQDSIVNHLGNETPKILVCLHEEHSVSIAHGWAQVTNEPLAAIVHTNVGLMHATMTIFNVWCDRMPAIIIGATGPADAEKRRPWIEWIHTSIDQGALVRDYTKWDDQPASVPAAFESLLRAYQLSLTAPCGPVYICLDAAIQDCELENQIAVPDPARFQPAAAQEASPEVLRQAAKLLLEAKKPVILPGRVSRSREKWDLRIRLAEFLGASVLTELKVGAAFPTGHPLHGAGSGFFFSKKAIELIGSADRMLYTAKKNGKNSDH